MLEDALSLLDNHIDSLAYVALVIVLAVTAIHADKRYTQERNRNEGLERRVRSLVLVVRFQQSLVDAKLPEAERVSTTEGEAELLDLGVDEMISKLGYCLTCHRLRAPAHFKQTDHLQLEDNQLLGSPTSEH